MIDFTPKLFHTMRRCGHQHETIEDALRCGDAPLGAFVRRIVGGIEYALDEDDIRELRDCIKRASRLETKRRNL